jgi:hypothetical protein
VQKHIDRPAFPPEMSEHFECLMFSQIALYTWTLTTMNAASLDDFVDNVVAHFLSFREEQYTSETDATLRGSPVAILTTVLPFARSVLCGCQSIQLDEIFQALSP